MTGCAELVERYVESLAGTFACTELDEGRALIATPYTYSDGDNVEVLATIQGDRLSLTDFGTTLSRVALAGANIHSPTLKRALDASVKGFRIDVLEQALRVEGTLDQTPDMLMRLIGAMREVDALSHVRPEPRSPAFETRVLSHLRSSHIQLTEHPRISGKSGTLYRLTAEVVEPRRTLVHAVAGGGSEAGIRSVTAAYRAFSDINGSRPTEEKLVVMSGDGNWRMEDIRLLKEVAYVAGWWELGLLDSFLRGTIPPDRQLFAGQVSVDDAVD
jgi:hypothetical protein